MTRKPGTVTYRGGCHCRALQFSFESEPITSGVRCNCSLCRRRGAVMSVAYFENVVIEGREALALYLWGDECVNHYFCRTCGIYPFHEALHEPGKLRINLGCIDGLDPYAVSITMIDGASFLLS